MGMGASADSGGEPLPEPDLIAIAESDPGAADGDDVVEVTTGKYGWGQTYTLGYNVIDAAAISPVYVAKYRTPGTNGSPVVRKRDGNLQSLLYEITVRGGDQTDSGTVAARVEMGLDTATRTDLLLQYGETYCFGGAFYLDPDNFVFENVPGQDIVLFQLPKGADDDPYWTLANAGSDNFHLRSSFNGINIWNAGQTWAQLRGHLCRWMMRQYLHENDGTIEWWWALDDAELTKQDLANTDPNADATVWEGDVSWPNGVATPVNSRLETTTSRRLRLGHYGDEPYGQSAPYNSTSVMHRLWWTGLEVLKSTDPDDIWAVEPPTLEP